jgi:hypothetical protein
LKKKVRERRCMLRPQTAGRWVDTSSLAGGETRRNAPQGGAHSTANAEFLRKALPTFGTPCTVNVIRL